MAGAERSGGRRADGADRDEEELHAWTEGLTARKFLSANEGLKEGLL